LLKNLKRPNLKLEEVFKATREEVMTQTGNKQVPWDSSSIKGDFYFVQKDSPVVEAVKNNQTETTITAKSRTEQEREAWDLVKNSADAEDFRFFLKEFPSGANADKAKIRLEELVWQTVKNSTDKTKVQAYLNDFPNGANASAARIKLRQLEAANTTTTQPTTTNNSSVTRGTVRKNSIGTELVYIPAGEFMMGSSDAEIDEALFETKKYFNSAERSWFSNESPKHKVTIKDGFWMGKFEVTQAEWQAVMGDNPSKFKECGGNCPVEQVSWDDIQVFLKRLNQKNDGFEYRLPTEAEWEYAARAGTTTAFAFGNSLNSSQANFNGNYPYASTKGNYIGKTVKVGSYSPNNFGLYDMHGNVWEWVQDIYNSSYSNLPVDGSANMSVGDSSLRVLRGGSWSDYGVSCRSADRGRYAPATRNYDFGFRLVARARSL
jgi:formylglycine-generating enzyme required for sulfatase activity